MADGDTPPVATANEYRHEDGTTEVVYVVEDGRVLTIREYPDTEAFERSVADAAYLGEHRGVAELPGVSEMRGLQNDADPDGED